MTRPEQDSLPFFSIHKEQEETMRNKKRMGWTIEVCKSEQDFKDNGVTDREE